MRDGSAIGDQHSAIRIGRSASAFPRSTARLERAKQAGNHLTDLDNTARQAPNGIGIEHFEITDEQELIFQLAGGTTYYVQESHELFVAFASTDPQEL